MKKENKQIYLTNTFLSKRIPLYKNFKKNKSIKRLNVFCYLGKIQNLNEIKLFTTLYIKENLEKSGYKITKLGKNFLIKNQNKILKLPTISQNGAIYPKDETQLIYNILVNYIFKSLKKILPYIESITYPTIRFKTKKKAKNSFSTNQIHSDAWSSGNISDAVISFPILGDIKNNGVDFFEVKKTDKRFFSEKKTYTGTNILYGDKKKIYSMKKNFWVIFDHSILHKTKSTNYSKPRVSIDLIVRLKRSKKKKIKNFYSPSYFSKIGENVYIKSMENFKQLNLRKQNLQNNKISQKIVKI